MVTTKRAVSSGAVIYKIEDGQIFICLIERTDREVWGLPKGTIANGETPEQTATREVEEETGLKGEIVERLGSIDYWFYWKPEKARYHKTVHFFLMKYVSGDTASHDWEVKTAQWFPIEEATARMSYKNEIEMVKKAGERIQHSL
jgi:8-oxo-dGTP pyrophosphatase MutT (NUDIX family)